MNKISYLARRMLQPLAASAPSAAPEDLSVIPLPEPRLEAGSSLMEALGERRTSREFAPGELSPQTLSDLLWAACGVNRPESGHRTAPSARNSQEIDIYIATSKGLFLYCAKEHGLSPVLATDIRALTGRQSFICDAPVNLVYVVDFSRMKSKSASQRILYSAIDTGFMSQNVCLYCASEGLANCVRGTINREVLARSMKLGRSQEVILAQSVGYPK